MRKLFPKLNISRQLLSRGVSLVVVFTTLVTAYVAFSLNESLGWFSENKTVTADGMSANVYKSEVEVTFQVLEGNEFKYVESIAAVISRLKVPGQSVTFTITVKNVGEKPVTLTALGIAAPSEGDEVPKVVGNTSYYLSTELTTKLTGIDNTAWNVNEDLERPLRAGDGTVGQINYFDWLEKKEDNSSSQNTATNKEIQLEKQQYVTFTVVVTFVNKANENQNEYKNFADNGGKCQREFFITYKD